MIITLCGSTKFKKEFEEYNYKLTMSGHVVISVASFIHEAGVEVSEKEKSYLDNIHKLKILNSDAIFVIDKDKYIGFSTNSEIQWAILLGRPVYYMTNKDHVDKLIKGVTNG